jgi:hypothetical protein
MDCGTYCAGIAAVTHPPYTKTPTKICCGLRIFCGEIDKGAFSVKKLGQGYRWIMRHTSASPAHVDSIHCVIPSLDSCFASSARCHL